MSFLRNHEPAILLEKVFLSDLSDTVSLSVFYPFGATVSLFAVFYVKRCLICKKCPTAALGKVSCYVHSSSALGPCCGRLFTAGVHPRG